MAVLTRSHLLEKIVINLKVEMKNGLLDFSFFFFISFSFILHEVERNRVLPFPTFLNHVGGGVEGKPTERIQVIRANTGPCTWGLCHMSK